MEKPPLIHPDFNFLLPSYWLGQVDTRALSLFRILFALAMLKVAAYYLYIAELFFSDRGLVPRATMRALGRQTRFSVLDAFGEVWQVQAFFVLWLLVGFNLLIGHQTRWMALLNFIFILSVHERNTFILNGADTVMRVLSFWMLFIPLGQHYSVDAVARRWRRYAQTRDLSDLRVNAEAQKGFALPIRLIQIQVGLVYLLTFILKIPGEPWKNGSAMHYALQVKSLVLPTGDWVLSNSPYALLQVMSYFAFFTEAVFFLFVFIPLLQPIFRALALLMGTAMHLGIAFLMSIPNFSYVMIISYVTLCLPEWVDSWDKSLRGPRQVLVLPEPPANSPLWWLAALTRPSEIWVADFAEEGPSSWDDWVIFDQMRNEYRGHLAWRQACAHLPLSRLWMPLLRWGLLRRAIWQMGGLTLPKPTLPPQSRSSANPPRFAPELVWLYRGGVAVFLLWIMLGVVWWNLHTVRLNNGERLVSQPPPKARLMVQWLGMWQYWNMFAPYPTTRDGWLIINAEFEDGRNVDLMTGQAPEVSWQRWYWGPHRWKKFTSNLRDDGDEELFRAMGAYYCRRHNAGLKRGERLATLEIQYHSQRAYAPHAQPNPIEARLLWRHWCFPEYASP